MSATVSARVSPRAVQDSPRDQSRRPRLRRVEAPARRRRPRLAYGIVALTGALVIGGAQMALSIITTQGSYEMSSLSTQQSELTWQRQILHDEVIGLSSPQYLAANASALGMVIEEAPSYLRLSDGAILGTSSAALGGSSIDAIGRATVPNALIAETPLVTDPGATIDGATAIDGGLAEDGVSNTPLPITDGLPTPSTH